jgi:hypothetical protein
VTTNREVFFDAVATLTQKYKDALADNQILLEEIGRLRLKVAALEAEALRAADEFDKQMAREIRANMGANPEFGYYPDERQ